MKKSREKLKAVYMAVVDPLFDELLVWDEQTQEPDLTQIDEIVLKLPKRLGEQLAQKVLLRQEQRQSVEKRSPARSVSRAFPPPLISSKYKRTNWKNHGCGTRTGHWARWVSTWMAAWCISWKKVGKNGVEE